MKNVKRLVCALLFSTFAGAVFAACGDFTCGFIGQDFMCIAEAPGGYIICTENNPCTINYP
jgi:hypothetical protein